MNVHAELIIKKDVEFASTGTRFESRCRAQLKKGLYPYIYPYPYKPRKRAVAWLSAEDTHIINDSRAYERADIVLFVGSPICYPNASGKMRTWFRPNFIYRVHNVEGTSNRCGKTRYRGRIALCRAGTKYAMSNESWVLPTEIRHLTLECERERLKTIQNKDFHTHLSGLVTDRLCFEEVYRLPGLSDCKRLYVAQCILFQPSILADHGIEANIGAILSDPEILEEAFWILWDEDILRLVEVHSSAEEV